MKVKIESLTTEEIVTWIQIIKKRIEANYDWWEEQRDERDNLAGGVQQRLFAQFDALNKEYECRIKDVTTAPTTK